MLTSKNNAYYIIVLILWIVFNTILYYTFLKHTDMIKGCPNKRAAPENIPYIRCMQQLSRPLRGHHSDDSAAAEPAVSGSDPAILISWIEQAICAVVALIYYVYSAVVAV